MPFCGAMCSWWWILPLLGLLFMLAACAWMYHRRRAFGGGGFGCCVGLEERPRDGALEVLRRRYAAGEITREQYQAMRKEVSD